MLVEDDRDRQGFNTAVLSELLLPGLLQAQAHPEFSTHANPAEGKNFNFGSTDDGSADI